MALRSSPYWSGPIRATCCSRRTRERSPNCRAAAASAPPPCAAPLKCAPSVPICRCCRCARNVHTRLAKLERGEVDATLLAAAGLDRLGLGTAGGVPLEPQEMLPAVGQGAIGVACRSEDLRMRALLAPLRTPRAWLVWQQSAPFGRARRQLSHAHRRPRSAAGLSARLRGSACHPRRHAGRAGALFRPARRGGTVGSRGSSGTVAESSGLGRRLSRRKVWSLPANCC